MKIHSSSLSDSGLVRRENQDSSGFFPDRRLFIIADGMGGHVGGKQASQLAVQTLEERFTGSEAEPPRSSRADEDPAVSRLIDGIHEANRRIFEHAAADEHLRGMGTTLVAMLFSGDSKAIIAHVGDSRAYRLRDGRVEQLTRDHSLVADLLRNHEISESEASTHPYRHMLTRALGIAAQVSPDVTELDVRVGDLYVLCTDGVYGMISPEDLARTMSDHQNDPDELCRQLIAAANAGGGKDNSTAVAIRCVDD